MGSTAPESKTLLLTADRGMGSTAPESKTLLLTADRANQLNKSSTMSLSARGGAELSDAGILGRPDLGALGVGGSAGAASSGVGVGVGVKPALPSEEH